MQSTIVTPQKFFDLFILCLSWQWSPFILNRAWTTVDKVSRILCGLGIITGRQRANLYKDPRVQSVFMKSIYRVPAHRLNYHMLMDNPSKLIVSLDAVSDINRRRLLRDYRLYLTQAGKKYADRIADDYSPVTRKMYFDEIERQGELKSAAITTRYRQKVEAETEETEEE